MHVRTTCVFTGSHVLSSIVHSGPSAQLHLQIESIACVLSGVSFLTFKASASRAPVVGCILPTEKEASGCHGVAGRPRHPCHGRANQVCGCEAILGLVARPSKSHQSHSKASQHNPVQFSLQSTCCTQPASILRASMFFAGMIASHPSITPGFLLQYPSRGACLP